MTWDSTHSIGAVIAPSPTKAHPGISKWNVAGLQFLHSINKELLFVKEGETVYVKTEKAYDELTGDGWEPGTISAEVYEELDNDD